MPIVAVESKKRYRAVVESVARTIMPQLASRPIYVQISETQRISPKSLVLARALQNHHDVGMFLKSSYGNVVVGIGFRNCVSVD